MGGFPTTPPSANQNRTAVQWTYLKDMTAWLTNPNIPMYGQWNHPRACTTCPGEGGVDLTAPPGTPVYALGTGPIMGAGYWKDIGHGVVTQRVNVPGVGPEDIYYQHIILDPNIRQCMNGPCGSQIVQAGEQIGTVGQYGETEIGFNANWGQPWGVNHPGPWPNDPRPWIKALMLQAPASTPYIPSTPDTNTTQGSGNSNCAPWDIACIWNNLSQHLISAGVRIGLFILALVLVILGGIILIHPSPTDAIPGVRAVKSL